MIVEKHPNVFIDTAAYLYEIRQLLNRDLVKRLGSHKIIFGTDYPSPYAEERHEMKSFVDCIRSLDLSTEILQGIFSDNFNILLNGTNETSDTISTKELMDNLSRLSKQENSD
jgi:predicted TIM-barrel fold metal-dependent hydrolase